MQMNPRERLLAAIRGDAVDRVPLHLPGFHACSRDEIAEWDDPLRRQVAERIFDETHFEVGVDSYINRMLVTPPQRIREETRTLSDGCSQTTGIIETPRGPLTYENRFHPEANTSWQVKYPVECTEDIARVASVPWELPEGLKPPRLDALPEGFKERGILRTGISSPFVCVAGMMPYQMFLELCATHYDLLLELTETCRTRILDCLGVLFSEPGIEYVWMGGSEWVTPPMGSTALYDGLVQEQEQSLIAFVKERSDAVVHIHCHGHVRHAIQRTIERDGDYTEPVEPPPDGDITMAEAKRLANGRITLGGNVECRVLANESEHVVEQATRAAFEGGNDRFVLRTSEGPSPRMSEQEFRNHMRLIDVWEELSG
jgi:hypothetical protein